MDEGEGKRGREEEWREREDAIVEGLTVVCRGRQRTVKAFGALHPLLGPLIERDRERRGGREPEGEEGSGEDVGGPSGGHCGCWTVEKALAKPWLWNITFSFKMTMNSEAGKHCASCFFFKKMHEIGDLAPILSLRSYRLRFRHQVATTANWQPSPPPSLPSFSFPPTLSLSLLKLRFSGGSRGLGGPLRAPAALWWPSPVSSPASLRPPSPLFLSFPPPLPHFRAPSSSLFLPYSLVSVSVRAGTVWHGVFRFVSPAGQSEQGLAPVRRTLVPCYVQSFCLASEIMQDAFDSFCTVYLYMCESVTYAY